MKKSPAILFLVGYLAYGMVYVCRMNLSVASPLMQQAGLISKTQMGWLSSLFFVTYSVGQLCNGYLGDRLHTRSMVCTGLLLAGVCNIAIGTLPAYGAVLLLWGVNGYAQSMIWGPLLRMVSGAFGEKGARYVASVLISSVAAGSVVGILLATFAVWAGGIFLAFVLPGCLALLVCGGVLCVFRGRVAPQVVGRVPLRKLLRQPRILAMLFPAMIHGVLKDNINLWAPIFFSETFSSDLALTALYVLVILLVSLAGRLIYPLLYKLCSGREHLVSRLALTTSAVVLLPLCAGTSAVVSAVCLSVAAAAISVVNTSLLSVYPMDYARLGGVSSVAGLMDFVTYLGAGISSAVYGYILENSGFKNMYASWVALCILAVLLLIIYERKYSSEKALD